MLVALFVFLSWCLCFISLDSRFGEVGFGFDIPLGHGVSARIQAGASLDGWAFRY